MGELETAHSVPYVLLTALGQGVWEFAHHILGTHSHEVNKNWRLQMMGNDR